MNVAAPAHKAPDIGGVYDAGDEQRRLAEIMEGFYLRILTAVTVLVDASLPKAKALPRVDDPSTRRMLQHAANRVVRIDETTRQAIAEMIQRGQALGLSTWEIAHGRAAGGYPGIDGLFRETWAGRADTVARTELQEAQRLSALDRYTSSGMVDRVKIIDGDFDEVCSNRNGKVVPIEQAPGLAHPNCKLVLTPVMREGL